MTVLLVCLFSQCRYVSLNVPSLGDKPYGLPPCKGFREGPPTHSVLTSVLLVTFGISCAELRGLRYVFHLQPLPTLVGVPGVRPAVSSPSRPLPFPWPLLRFHYFQETPCSLLLTRQDAPPVCSPSSCTCLALGIACCLVFHCACFPLPSASHSSPPGPRAVCWALLSKVCLVPARSNKFCSVLFNWCIKGQD